MKNWKHSGFSVDNSAYVDKDDEFQENLYSADPSLMTDFISESTEHIDLINPLLLELEVDPEHEENINSVFRACHTIKGVAGFLALTNLPLYEQQYFLDCISLPNKETGRLINYALPIRHLYCSTKEYIDSF